MTGLTDIAEIMAGLEPSLDEKDFVFCSVGECAPADMEKLQPAAMVREAEGVTLVLHRAMAEQAGLEFHGIFRRITLGVHSSLEAVGLTAAVAGALARQGISANMIAAYHHDHVFVPADMAVDAMKTIGELT